MGQAHYDNALKGQTLGATFFVYVQGKGWIDKASEHGLGGKQGGGVAKGVKKTKENPSGLLGPSGGFSNFGIESQNLNFFKRVSSSRLTNGAVGRTRTCNLPVRSREFYPLNYDCPEMKK